MGALPAALRHVPRLALSLFTLRRMGILDEFNMDNPWIKWDNLRNKALSDLLGGDFWVGTLTYPLFYVWIIYLVNIVDSLLLWFTGVPLSILVDVQ